MGRVASPKSNRRGRPSAEVSYRRPSGANADGAATKRNVIPWKDMEKELAKRLAAKAAACGEPLPDIPDESKAIEVVKPADVVEPAPDSGVRTSPSDAELPPPDLQRPLTYSMYTISALDMGEAGP